MLLRNIKVDGCPSDIVIDGGVVKNILPAGACPTEGMEVEECGGKTLIPGLINMHTHSAMSLMRGMGEDAPLHKWLADIWDIESRIDPEYIYWGTKAAILEMLHTGTTSFNDQYWWPEEAHRAAEQMGVCPMLTYVLLDGGDREKAARQRDECIRTYERALSWKDGSRFAVSVHAVYTVSEEMVLWAVEFARKHGLKLHIHLSETEKEVADCKAAHGGLSPVEYFDRLGVLGPDTIAAHTLWLSDGDIEILGRRKVSCVHNINSNLKLSSGYKFRYQELRDAGANVCIGTDGCASSNNLDLLEAMKTACLVQKAWRHDPEAFPVREVLQCATVNAARAMGVDAGRIAVGAKADFCIVDTDNTYFLSPGPFEANLIHSAGSRCIDSVMAGGRFVMKHGRVEGEEEIIKGARKVLGKLS